MTSVKLSCLLSNCRKVAKCIWTPEHVEHPEWNLDVGDESNQELEEVPEGEEIQRTSQETLGLIRKVHRNLGHPHRAVLVRMLKDAGASEDVLQVARQFECEVCRRHGRKSSVRPSAVPHVTEVWDTISIDTFGWSSAHLDENGKPLNLAWV